MAKTPQDAVSGIKGKTLGGTRVAAVGYLRVSGKGQVKGDGFPRQREAVARYAAAQRIEMVGEYLDQGVSGRRELEDREGLSELFARIRSNGVRLVLIERADRLARDLMVGEVILAEFRKLGAKVIAVDSGTELTVGDDDPTRTLIRQVLGAVAQFEKAVIVSKLRAARVRKKKATGRCEGRKPFGARPGEAAVIVRMVALRAEGGSFATIAERLNVEGAPTRTGTLWAAETVRGVLARSTAQATSASGTSE